MPLFSIPKRAGREQDNKLAKKSNTSRKVQTTVRGGNSLLAQINQIKAMVEKHLGQFKDDYVIIRNQDELHDYFAKCVNNGVVAIDTETTGLDPILDSIVGLCLYTPNQPAAYVPINHTSYVTGARVDNQLTEQDVAEEFDMIIHDTNIEIIMFNAKFDMRVIRNQLGVKDIYCTWDAYLAARLMNENEERNGLKALHNKYVLDGKGDAFSFDDLFKGIPADKIPINTFYLYAAHDAIITYELYQYQKQFVYYDRTCTPEARNGMNGVSWVFFNIEMPCIKVVCDMEDNGIKFDFEYNQFLKDKYHALLDDRIKQFNAICDTYRDDIEAYRRKMGVNCKLDDPINIKSSTQLAILLYDIMGCEVPVDKKTKKEVRTTNEATLKSMDNPVAKAVLDYREFSTIVDTFIDKLPNCVNPKDGRIHCSFNQYGARTGRMSSENPNLQNIPSHNKEIRKMFVASDGYVLMSSDFSQQEPKCLAAMCKRAGDSQMYETFMHGKDLYSEIASKAFNVPYDDCREFRPDGTVNKQGKERRTQAKSVLLGVLYGRGEASIGEQLNVSTKKAKDIKDSVFKGFPAIKEFEESSLDMAYELGYVTTVCNRKRRLPDLQLPEYEFKWKDGAPPDDDLLDFDLEEDMNEPEVPEDIQRKYLKKLQNCYFSQKRKIFEEANKEGIWIVDNGAKIADAQRQCVNARIQGSAADLTKLAMIELSSNKRLQELGFRLLVPVHDEVIAECPEENVKECSKLLAETMSHAAEEILEMPIRCDVEITKAWYGDSIDGI